MRGPLRAFAVFSGSLLLAGSARAQATHSNILMIIADDVGVEMIGAYDEGTSPANTPAIDQLAAEGVMFTNTWSNPLCAATRATIQTGRYGYRTGIRGASGSLQGTEVTIPEVLAAAGYRSAIIGKWGLATTSDTATHPLTSGYDYFAGVLGPTIANYFYWNRLVAPQGSQPPSGFTTEYATSANVHDAEVWLGQNKQDPWFLVLSFNAAHSVPVTVPGDTVHAFQAPPGNLHTMGDLPDSVSPPDPPLPQESCPLNDSGPCYRAMIEAMDTKIGHMLAWLTQEQELAQTIVIFVGDNGSPKEVASDPQRSKGTLFEGGVNVPLIMKGPGVVGSGTAGQPRVSEALVNTSDLFMTVRDLANVDGQIPGNPIHDSYSLVPILDGAANAIRHFVYAEVEGAHAGKAIRNRAGFKLQRSFEGGQLRWFFYDVNTDPTADNLVYETGNTPILKAPDPDPALQAQLDQLKCLFGDGNVTHWGPPEPNLPPANLDQDADGDGLTDACDNCRDVFQDASQRWDTDRDGYGNLCDGDFDNDGLTLPSDYDIWLTDYTTTGLDGGTGTDMDCDEYVSSSDYAHFSEQYQGSGVPGPSGLVCAGTVPCPAP